MRRLLITLAAAALLVAACGDDDDASADADGGDTTAEVADDGAPPMGPAELTADDQSGDGTELTVASVTLPAAGYVAVHADADGAPGPVIGHSELLPEGESTDVVVPLDPPVDATATVWPMAHVDTNENGEYDFAPPEVTDDGPATFEDGEVAVVPIEYSLDGADEAGGDGGEEAVSISGFAFVPETIEVSPGDTIGWTNEDGVTHTVTAGTPGSATGTFDESLDAGATADVVFDEAGTYEYFCAIHPTMTGTVVVS